MQKMQDSQFYGTERRNNIMNNYTKENYYALFIAIVKNETTKKALSDMGICPDSIKEEEE